MTRTRRFALTIACTALLAACGQGDSSASDQVQATEASRRAEAPGLTESYASFRKQQVATVDYELAVSLDAEGTHFTGQVVANTHLSAAPDRPLTIDFSGGEVLAVRIEGKEIPYDYNNYFISIEPQYLQEGANAIAVDYRHPYSTDGSGLHRFEDPEDGRVYMYTNFQPYDANKLFPHFDQPNLKAHYTLSVTAPADWVVVSAVRESRVEKNGDLREWHFPQSAKFSSYIFSLHAGPYQVWEDDTDGTPLRLLARQSLAQYVKPDDWFTFTRQSFEFFQPYFDLDYPFGKYDQLIVPDFNAGAMENVAAVTFSEGYVSRGEKTQAQRMQLANVIAHELAHMWFGNLVTMNWWDDLWLNESFATYMANLALAESSEFRNSWENFYLGTKQWAYWSDQLPTTHAIQLPVRNTDEAFANFDGITYGKGGSILKQLPFYLGAEAFRQGVRNYLRDLAYQNSTLDDFMGHLGRAAGKDLQQWQEQWLYQPGLNTLEASFQCESGKVTSLVLNQSAPAQYPTLREQRTQLGFYNLQGNSMVLTETLPVVYQGEKTRVPAARGLACPEILNPNEGDWAFVKVSLDPVSLDNVSKHINDIATPFTRLMLWQSLYDSFYDARLPLDDYVHFVLENAGAERDINVIRLLARHLGNVYDHLAQVDVDEDTRTALRQAIETFAWQQLQGAPAGSDAQKTWFGIFTTVAHSDAALASAREMLMGELQLDGLKLDPEKRWKLVYLQNEHLYGDYQQAVERELDRDASDRSQLQAIAAETVRPLPEAKARWLDNIIEHHEDFKTSQLGTAADNLFPASQLPLYQQQAGRIIAAIDKVTATGSPIYNAVFSGLFPLNCRKEGVAQLDEILQDGGELSPIMEKALKNRRDGNRRCIAISRLLADGSRS